jgi:hypothetical protein
LLKEIFDMKHILLLVIPLLLGFGLTSSADAQNFMDYISEIRGDTAVVKNLAQMGELNSLVDAIESDPNPDGRVYLLVRGTNEAPSLYLQDRGYTVPTGRLLTIVGEDAGPIVGGTVEDGRPPLIAGAGGQEGYFYTFFGDFTLKNLAIATGSNTGGEGWWTFGPALDAPPITATFENVLMEHNNWVFFQANDANRATLIIRDSYFINMTGVGCRRNGGVYDSVAFPLEELIVENSTHVQASGMMYKFRNFPAKRVVFNHNTFVNSTGQIFTSFGYEYNMIVANNLFVNSNVQAYYPGLDDTEYGFQHQPHGIINLDHFTGTNWAGEPHGVNPNLLPNGLETVRKVLVDRNGIYWDPRLAEIVDYLNDNNIPCDDANCSGIAGEWMSQMITMNERTQSLFDDNETYPFLTEGVWFEGGDPNFVFMEDNIDDLIAWGIATAPAGNDDLLPKFRHPNNMAVTGEPDNFLRFDWPLYPNLVYTNDAYLTAGLGGYPLGDLNWFPEQKAAWEAEKDDLYAELQAALDEGRPTTSVREIGGTIPSSIHLAQNYPNPFNPTTEIQFSLPNQVNVTLEVYDITGRLVTTLINENMSTGNYSVTWDATNRFGQTVSSGVYLYRLQAGDIVETKRMTFIK